MHFFVTSGEGSKGGLKIGGKDKRRDVIPRVNDKMNTGF